VARTQLPWRGAGKPSVLKRDGFKPYCATGVVCLTSVADFSDRDTSHEESDTLFVCLAFVGHVASWRADRTGSFGSKAIRSLVRRNEKTM